MTEDLSDENVVARIAEIARRLDGEQARLSRAVTDQIAHEIHDLDADPLLHELLLASVDGNVTTILHVLQNDIPVDHLMPTTAAVEYALRLAQRGIPSPALMRAYHMGQDSFRRQAVEAIHGTNLSPEMRLAVIERVTSTLYAYIDRITQLVLAEYELERDRWSAAQGNVLASYIHALLAGGSIDRSAFAAAARYPLEQHHLGVIVWYDGDEPAADEHRSLETTVRELANSLHTYGSPLFAAVDQTTAWAWIPLGGATRLHSERTTTHQPANPRHRIAVGLPSSGVEGFRRTHEQAESARSLVLAAPARTGRIVGFGDQGVAITALLTQLPAATASWVRAVLGTLAEDDEAHEVLRETLRVFLSTGENYALTAEALMVHRNTVKYRITKVVEERERELGRSLSTDRLDVALALQACHFLGGLVLLPVTR